MNKPKVNEEGSKHLDQIERGFTCLADKVKHMDVQEMNAAPLLEQEPQTKMSNREMHAKDAPYIKPIRSVNNKEPFNEKFRKEWEEKWKYVKCMVENNELIGEPIELWTKRFPGDPAHFWKIPVNKPVYIPLLVAEQLQNCKYHRMTMDNTVRESGIGGTIYGTMAVTQTVARLDARPVGNVFVSMGS